MKKDFYKCIKSMLKYCKLVILARDSSIKYKYMHLVEYLKLYRLFIYLTNKVWH